MDELPCWPRYRPIRVIGQGGFGTVYLCVDTESSSPMFGQQVAVKAISLSALSDEEVLMAMSEVSLLKNLSHPNIITYYDSFLYDEEPLAQSSTVNTTSVRQGSGGPVTGAGAGFRSQWLCLVTEYMDGGDLVSLLRQYNRQGLSSTNSLCRGTRSRTVVTAVAAHKRSRSQAAVTNDVAAVVDEEVSSEAGWAGRSRLHRQRLATSLSTVPRLPMPAPASRARKATLTQWSGLDLTAEQTWLSDASAAAMPPTPLGATDVEAADTVRHDGSSSGRGAAATGSSAALYGKSTAAAEDPASASREPQLPPLPNQVWLESFLITDIAKQCLEALAYLHALCIVHRDIKPSNIYLSKSDGAVKLGDFGVSKLLQPASPLATTFVGTPFYLCPELCMGNPYSFGADVWALGVVLYELYCLKLPFASNNVLGQIYVITEGSYDTDALSTPHAFPESQRAFLEALYGPSFLQSERLLHSLVMNLVLQMLRVDPAERPSAEALLTGLFGAGGMSRCGSSAGLVPVLAAPASLESVPSARVVSRSSVSVLPQHEPPPFAVTVEDAAMATLETPPKRLGYLASKQHAQWAGSLVAAASNVFQQPQQLPDTPLPPPQGASLAPPTATVSHHASEWRDGAEVPTPLAVRVRSSMGDILHRMPSAQRERLGSRTAAEERGDGGGEELSQVILPMASPRSTSSWMPPHSAAQAGDKQRALSSLSPTGRGQAGVSTPYKSGSSAASAAPLPREPAKCVVTPPPSAAVPPLEQLDRDLTGTGDSAAKSAGAAGEQCTVEDASPLGSLLEKPSPWPAPQLALESAADTPLIGRARKDDEDALDRPIGPETHSEMMALVENIPWLKNADVFSAIPLSPGCDDVMFVERANRSSLSCAGEAASNSAQGRGEDAANLPKGLFSAPQQQYRLPLILSPSVPLRSPLNPRHPPRCPQGGCNFAEPATDTDNIRLPSGLLPPVPSTGALSSIAARMEVMSVGTSGGSSPHSQFSLQRDAARATQWDESTNRQTVLQRRISGGSTAPSGQPPPTSAMAHGRGVLVNALSTTALISTPARPASREGNPQTSGNGPGPEFLLQLPEQSGGAGKPKPVVKVVGRCGSFLRPRLFSSPGCESIAGNAASEARLRPVSTAQTRSAETTAVGRAAPVIPKACAPGRCEGYSTAELEALLRAKLFAHYQQQQRKWRAQRAQQRAQEVAKAEAHARVRAVYEDAFISQLGARAPGMAYTGAAARRHPVDSGGRFAGYDALATSPAHVATQLPSPQTEATAKGVLLPPVTQEAAAAAAFPSPHNSTLPFSLEATARQAETEVVVLRALSVAHACSLEIPSVSAPGAGAVAGGGDESKDWFAATSAAHRIREAASLAAAVEKQRDTLRRGKAPACVCISPVWRPPHDSRDVPGLWETSSAEEETDAAARGRMGRCMPARVREEVRWRWSAPPSDVDDTVVTTSTDEETRASPSSSSTSLSISLSKTVSLASSSVSQQSVCCVNTPDASQKPETMSSTTTTATPHRRRCVQSPNFSHSPVMRSSGESDASSRNGQVLDKGSFLVSLRMSSLPGASAKAKSAALDDEAESGSTAVSSVSSVSSTPSASQSLTSHRVLDLGHVCPSQGEVRTDVSSNSVTQGIVSDDDSSADSTSSSSSSSSDSSQASASPTASCSLDRFDCIASSNDSDAETASSAATKNSESDEDEDMSYAYTVQIDADTGQRYFEYVCPVTVEVVGVLPGGCRVVPAATALQAMDCGSPAAFSETLTLSSGPSSVKQGQGGHSAQMRTPEAPAEVSSTPKLYGATDDTAVASCGISSTDDAFGQARRPLLDREHCSMWQEDAGSSITASSTPPLLLLPPFTSLSALPAGAGTTQGFTGAPDEGREHVSVVNTLAPPKGPQSARAAAMRTARPSKDNWQTCTTARNAATPSKLDDDDAGNRTAVHISGRAAPLHCSGAPGAKAAAPLRPSHPLQPALKKNAPAKGQAPIASPLQANVSPTEVNTAPLPVPETTWTDTGGCASRGFLYHPADAQGREAANPSQTITEAVARVFRVRVPSSSASGDLSNPALAFETSQQQQHSMLAPPQYICLPRSLALRPLRQRTRFVGLLWRLWMSLNVADPALRSVLLHRSGSTPSPSVGCTFAEAFGDWVTRNAPARITSAGQSAEDGVSQPLSDKTSAGLLSRSIATTATTESFVESETAAKSQKLGALASLTASSESTLRKWGLYYVDVRTGSAVKLSTDADWAVVRRKVGEAGTRLPFVRLYLLLEEAEVVTE
ncbi:hypothetical protein JKF63_05067 [Porcisia hertigi]|uniref:non-specific serine/threonine protein kinase n=1 Tax=Porcisia hertigi TaxID=2761500 RepID=A0A836LB41_9TRYP|nr:hypothetical protein JKF63_05067 [Porcisia hertigi]